MAKAKIGRKASRKTGFDELTRLQRMQLRHGTPPHYAPDGFRTVAEMQVAWESFRTEIIADWKKHRRPWEERCFAEWLFDLIPAHGERHTTRNFLRLSDAAVERMRRDRWGVLHTITTPPMQESEIEYLQRHGLT